MRNIQLELQDKLLEQQEKIRQLEKLLFDKGGYLRLNQEYMDYKRHTRKLLDRLSEAEQFSWTEKAEKLVQKTDTYEIRKQVEQYDVVCYPQQPIARLIIDEHTVSQHPAGGT